MAPLSADLNISAMAVRVALGQLRMNPLRTALSTLGIVMGVGALVSVLALGDGMERYAKEQIRRTTDLHAVSITPSLYRTVDGQRFPRTDVVTFTKADADAVADVLRGLAAVRLALSGQALARVAGDTTPAAVEVFGAVGEIRDDAPRLAAGRFLDASEMDGDARRVVISRPLAAKLWRGRDVSSAVGGTLLVDSAAFTVVGVLDSVPGQRIVMPFGAARSALPPAPGRAPVMLANAGRVEDVGAIRSRLEAFLSRRYGSSWSTRVTIGTNESRVAQATQGLFLFKLFMGSIAGISLLVGGVGIMNVLLASVVERTREVGIRKALGARQRQIMLQFLSESVTISGIGSAIGIALGAGVAFGATTVMRRMSAAPIYAGFSTSTLVVAVIASVSVGMVFGLYPAMRAAKLSPVDAMRQE